MNNGLTVITEQLLSIDDVLRLLMLIFFVAFFAWLLTTIGNFFPQFFASITRKYKNKNLIDIDHNRDFNVDHTSKILRYMTKKEVKKNHGRRLPFGR